MSQARLALLELLLLRERFGTETLHEALLQLSSDQGRVELEHLLDLLERVAPRTPKTLQSKPNRPVAQGTRSPVHIPQHLQAMSDELSSGRLAPSLRALRFGAEQLKVQLPAKITREKAVDRILIRLAELSPDVAEKAAQQAFGYSREGHGTFGDLAAEIMRTDQRTST